MKHELGIYIRELRERKKLGLRQVAKKSGISPGSLSEVESGKEKRFSYDKLKSLAPVLGGGDILDNMCAKAKVLPPGIDAVIWDPRVFKIIKKIGELQDGAITELVAGVARFEFDSRGKEYASAPVAPVTPTPTDNYETSSLPISEAWVKANTYNGTAYDVDTEAGLKHHYWLRAYAGKNKTHLAAKDVIMKIEHGELDLEGNPIEQEPYDPNEGSYDHQVAKKAQTITIHGSGISQEERDRHAYEVLNNRFDTTFIKDAIAERIKPAPSAPYAIPHAEAHVAFQDDVLPSGTLTPEQRRDMSVYMAKHRTEPSNEYDEEALNNHFRWLLNNEPSKKGDRFPFYHDEHMRALKEMTF